MHTNFLSDTNAYRKSFIICNAILLGIFIASRVTLNLRVNRKAQVLARFQDASRFPNFVCKQRALARSTLETLLKAVLCNNHKKARFSGFLLNNTTKRTNLRLSFSKFVRH